MIANCLHLIITELKRNLFNKASWICNGLFLIINLFIFNFTISSAPESFELFFISSVITSVLLAVVLVTNNIFDEDAQDGSLEQYQAFGISFSQIFLGKIISSSLEFAITICLTIPVAAIFYNVPASIYLDIILLILFSIPLLSSISIFGALLTINLRRSSTILILLVFPLLISCLIILSLASGEIMNGSDFNSAFSYIMINLGINLVLLPILTWLAGYLKE